MRREGLLFLTAVQFLTRLPVPDPGWEEGRLTRALGWFPVVGALIGVALALAWLAAREVFPPALAAGLVLALGIAVTGALHEDGLADTADALGGHAPRERALEIMRDSRIGTYGALALVLSLGLRWQALAAMTGTEGAWALVAAATIGKSAMVPVSRLMPYARAQGRGAEVASGASAAALAAAAVLSAGAVALTGLPGLAALLITCAAVSLVLIGASRRLGGYTGDILGAVEQTAQIAVLVTLAAWA